MRPSQEVRAIANATSAKHLIAELRLILDQANSNPAGTKQPISSRGSTEKFTSCWQDMTTTIQHGKSGTSHIISILGRIEDLLTELPASKRVKMQACFFDLHTEASNDLWKLCQSYGNAVDVYIPNRRSKAGKKEVRAIANATSVKYLIAELRLILDQADSKPAGTKQPISSRGSTKKFTSCWQDITTTMQHGKSGTSHIILILGRIEDLLTELPASKRVKMQAY
nr:hypothetical protein [Tanacetum cinerariifolium]